MNNPQEQFVRLAKAPAIVGQMTGQRPAVQTLHRWVQRGLAGVRLRTVYIGGHRHVSTAMLHEFFAAVTAAKSGASAPAESARAAGDTQGAVRRKRAERELDGI